MKAKRNAQIHEFNFKPGRIIAGKYTIESKLGAGWEGEVYKVVENRTGVRRAAKVFFPQRNERDRAVRIYAKKLESLAHCSMVIQYHHSETLRYKGVPVTCLISEFVQGQLLSHFVRRRGARRVQPFEALHILYELCRGVEEIHAAREYHGDLHDDNVLIRRRGIFFDLKVVDFYHWGRPTRAHYQDDVVAMCRLLYDMVGGAKRYNEQPRQIKDIVRGLRRSLILQSFPTVRGLRQHLETFSWEL